MSFNAFRFPEVETFDVGTIKDKGKKVLEEASELLEAVKEKGKDAATYEYMDVVQALANLATAAGWTFDDLEAAYAKVHASNVKRGRYQVDGSGFLDCIHEDTNAMNGDDHR